MEIRLFSGSAHPDLARRVAEALGVPLGKALVDRFPDGEVRVRLLESVRGEDVYLIQPTCPPVNDHLMELLLLADAARRSSAGRINAVIPYFGYARQDKQTEGREPISARLVAGLLERVGVERVIAIDLHAPQIQGFFDIPVDHLSAVRLFARYLREKGYVENAVVVSPDAGRAEEARRLAERLGLPLAMLAKRRLGPRETSVTYVIGDVEGKRPILVDDIVSTGGTIRRGWRPSSRRGPSPRWWSWPPTPSWWGGQGEPRPPRRPRGGVHRHHPPKGRGLHGALHRRASGPGHPPRPHQPVGERPHLRCARTWARTKAWGGPFGAQVVSGGLLLGQGRLEGPGGLGLIPGSRASSSRGPP